MSKVAIIDYEMGNLFSVQHACAYVGLDSIITKDCSVIKDCVAAILPGVGAFPEAMANLKRLGLDDCVKKFIATGKPFMGICLGLQLLFKDSEEFGLTSGMGIIDGHVLKFPYKNPSGHNLKVPQIGWNKIYQDKTAYARSRWEASPLNGLDYGEYMYFVHSFYTKPVNKKVELTLTVYEGIEYCSSVQEENIFAVQFHPEKSANKGMIIYKNWAKTIK